jgi:DNA-binding NtrC family response regulator
MMNDKLKMSMDMSMNISMMMKRRRTLLVIDDDPQICRLMERCLCEHFDEIITTTDPITAHAILEERRVTHILSDLFLGASADGITFLTLWKREFPHIERAVIFTAADMQAARADLRVRPCSAGYVDAVVSKADGINAIIAALLGEI